MRVIYTTEKEKQVQCKTCNSLLAYYRTDIISRCSPDDDGWKEFIECPICKRPVILRINGKEVKKV